MNREVPYDPEAVCDICGKKGAHDYLGDNICYDCTSPIAPPKTKDISFAEWWKVMCLVSVPSEGGRDFAEAAWGYRLARFNEMREFYTQQIRELADENGRLRGEMLELRKSRIDIMKENGKWRQAWYDECMRRAEMEREVERLKESATSPKVSPQEKEK